MVEREEGGKEKKRSGERGEDGCNTGGKNFTRGELVYGT